MEFSRQHRFIDTEVTWNRVCMADPTSFFVQTVRNTHFPWLSLVIHHQGRGIHMKDAILFSQRLEQIYVGISIAAQTLSLLFARFPPFFHEWHYFP